MRSRSLIRDHCRCTIECKFKHEIISTRNKRPPLLIGHISFEKGLALQEGLQCSLT